MRPTTKHLLRSRAISTCLVLLAFLQTSAPADSPTEVLPADSRDQAIPTPAQFFGFELGSRHLRHDEVVDYLRTLADASERVTLLPYAESHGARPLMVAAITSPENAKRLDEIRRERPQQATAPSEDDDSESLLVMYMGYGVHGDEASAMNAAPVVAYHLASSKSQQVSDWLADSIFLIDPALNPDGNDRFAHWVNANRGRFANNRNIDREHQQPWPGGRTNYYWFDLNRDWLPLTHPESKGRLRLFHQWKPNVVLDFHEMSGSSSYFFQPGIPERNNPLTPDSNYELTQEFAKYHARAMDEAVELFFTEERFDDFYMGKGSTYPDLHGAVGILFEQGSTRGLSLKNERSERSFSDTIANHVRTSLSSLEAAAQLRDDLIAHQRTFYQEAMQSGRSDDIAAYVLTGEASRIDTAERLLKAHRIRCWEPAAEISFDGGVYQSGTALIIPTAQAEVRFLRSLMSTQQEFEKNIFYDVSTWHLPSAMDLATHEIRQELPKSWFGKADSEDVSLPVSNADALVGYLLDAVPLSSARVVARLHRIDTDVRVLTQPVTVEHGSDEETFPAGSFLVLRQPNLDRWGKIERVLDRLAKAGMVTARPLSSSLTLSGPDLGSDALLRLPTCEPLLVVGPGTSAYSAGALWFHLDRRMGQPTTLVDTSDIRRAELADYTCVILPAGAFGDWGDAEARQLRRYVEDGGTLIGVASAIRWLERRKLISLSEQSKDVNAEAQTSGDSESPARSQPSDEQGLPRFGEARDRAALESIAGAFFSVEIDPTHPLGYGFPDEQVPVFRTHASRFPIPENPYQVAARYQHVIAGYVSKRNRERLESTAAVWVEPLGQGRIILLADDPTFRGYVRSSEKFLTNSILLGPKLQIPKAPISDGD